MTWYTHKGTRVFKKTKVHLIFDVMHDGRHKAMLVADAHLTDIQVNSVYSEVVSLRGIRLLLFIAELNKLQVWRMDIGNAYLEAKTKEKVCFIAGPEFKDMEGHLLTIHKALHGLQQSSDTLQSYFKNCLMKAICNS